MGVKWVRESDKYSVKTKTVECVCNIRVRNHQTFQNSCEESIGIINSINIA